MIEESTVFVVEHKEETMLPDLLIGAKRIIYVGDEMLTEPNVVRGMLVVRLRPGRLYG